MWPRGSGGVLAAAFKARGAGAGPRRRAEGVGARWRREGPRLRLRPPSEGRGGPGGARGPGKRRRAGLGGTFRAGDEVEGVLGAERRGRGRRGGASGRGAGQEREGRGVARGVQGCWAEGMGFLPGAGLPLPWRKGLQEVRLGENQALKESSKRVHALKSIYSFLIPGKSRPDLGNQDTWPWLVQLFAAQMSSSLIFRKFRFSLLGVYGLPRVVELIQMMTMMTGVTRFRLMCLMKYFHFFSFFFPETPPAALLLPLFLWLGGYPLPPGHGAFFSVSQWGRTPPASVAGSSATALACSCCGPRLLS